MGFSVKIGALEMKNPVILASGTAGYGIELGNAINDGPGAIILKTVTKNPRPGNKQPRLCETPAGLINSIGLQNEGIDDLIVNKIPVLKGINCKIIASIAGHEIEEFEVMIRKLNSIDDISAIELNLSCPNVKKGVLFGLDEELLDTLLKAVRKLTEKTLIAKLPPDIYRIKNKVKIIRDNSINAVSLINTVPSMAVNTDEMKVIISGGLSGPAVHPIALKLVYDICSEIRDFPVIAIGGVYSFNSMIDFIMAGASAVQVGTWNFKEPGISKKIIDDLNLFMDAKNISDISDIRGRILN